MAIDCCNGCVPPKRTPTCKFDGSCNKYAEAKAKHDAELEQIRKADRTRHDLYNQRGDGVRRAIRRRKV